MCLVIFYKCAQKRKDKDKDKDKDKSTQNKRNTEQINVKN